VISEGHGENAPDRVEVMEVVEREIAVVQNILKRIDRDPHKQEGLGVNVHVKHTENRNIAHHKIGEIAGVQNILKGMGTDHHE
jgi:hypothetical protein